MCAPPMNLMLKEAADRLRFEWGDKPDVRLIVTGDFGMALFFEKKQPGIDAWRGIGIFKCGELYFVPMESKRSRGMFATFEELLAKHGGALSGLVNQIPNEVTIFCRHPHHMRVIHGPNREGFIEAWHKTEAVWPKILSWAHVNRLDLLAGRPIDGFYTWPSILNLLTDLLERMPEKLTTSPRDPKSDRTGRAHRPLPFGLRAEVIFGEGSNREFSGGYLVERARGIGTLKNKV